MYCIYFIYRVDAYNKLTSELKSDFFKALASILRSRALSRNVTTLPHESTSSNNNNTNTNIENSSSSFSFAGDIACGEGENKFTWSTVSDQEMILTAETLATFTVICPNTLAEYILDYRL